MERSEREAMCAVRVSAQTTGHARLIIALRPYNPEGVSFIDSIQLSSDRRSWSINGIDTVQFDREPEKVIMSCYESGDVLRALPSGPERSQIDCGAGMATAVAVFTADAPVEVRIPIEESRTVASPPSWRAELNKCARLRVPDERLQRLYDTALSTLILHAPGEVYPGPYTYKRFWYRDAALILNALISVGARERTRRALDLFPRGQSRDGYFRSQEGEWDSNGEVLWILHRYCELSGEAVPAEWHGMIERGARWIVGKRMGARGEHPGLLPAGFSAEHLGPNDYYFWDDFWGVAGLRAAARMLGTNGANRAQEFNAAADEFLECVEKSIALATPRTNGAIPAAPGRRMDSGAVGSLVADFPLQLFPAGDPRIMATVEWLLSNSFVSGGFIKNMIHSGINAYLTLHVAQVLLRAGDARVHQLVDAVAALASPTGQWPEAIHPRTLGGCMGDGQHVWAAAEWIMMMRNSLIREEGDRLVIGGGVRAQWLQQSQPFGMERTLTPFGEVTVQFIPRGDALEATLSGNWRQRPPSIAIRVPGFELAETHGQTFLLRRRR
jgi:hypothetical protein